VRNLIFRSLALFILLAPELFLFNSCSEQPLPPPEPRAAIIDQLNPSLPDPAFIEQTTSILQNDSFKVDYYQGAQITVDLYRKLPSLGYSLILFRAHSGLLGNGSKTNQKTCLFTNQLYSPTSEIGDQLTNRLVQARVNQDPPLFGIGADFVSHSMQSQFNGTTVIMMGCSSLESDDLARAFVAKGASLYTGWNAEVDLGYVENATLTLLNRLAGNNLLPAAAIKETMQAAGPDPYSGAELYSCSSAK